jgi:tetratricopeptide (TPR) repeat protein
MIENNATPGLGDLEPFIVTLNNFKRKDLAEEVLGEFGKRAFSFAQYDNVARCFFKIRNYDKAVDFCHKALSVTNNPQEMYVIRTNLINAYNHANYPEKAMTYIKQCQTVIPDDVDIILERAYSLFLLDRKPEAEQVLRDTLSKFSDKLSEEYIIKIKFNLGTYHLYRDEFQQGLKLFLEEGAKMKFWNTESIFARSSVFDSPNSKFVKWDGKPKPGSTLIIQAEAGIGDEIINVRFVKRIEQMGMNVYWYEPLKERKDLLNFFNRQDIKAISDLKQIKTEGEIYYAQSMHLPIVLGIEYPDLWNGPYLSVDETHKNKWSWIKKDKPSIGIRWQGNPMYDHDLHRSYPLQQVIDLFKDYDVNLYSLQKDNGLEELNDNIIDLSSELKTWEDTVGAMSNMDLIITSCTSVAHASAACGFATAVMVPISAYYVWSHSMEKSPWYGDNVKLFRQKKPRVWDEPVKQLKQHIDKLYQKSIAT